jgi:glycosyltransferase involved in cell wall biosynthesis
MPNSRENKKINNFELSTLLNLRTDNQVSPDKVSADQSAPGDNSPLITIITVVYNNKDFLKKTIKSVNEQTYSNIEYIIVDGNSTDGTLDIIRANETIINHWVSEPDLGIYDAMNKGISLAKGTWLNFLNAGDIFFKSHTVADVAVNLNTIAVDAIYADAILKNYATGKEIRLKTNHYRVRINHQSLFYKRELHQRYGLYLVFPKLSIADYIFFNLIKTVKWRKIEGPISVNDDTGVSNSSRSLYLQMTVDMLFGKRSFQQSALIILLFPFLYPIYRTGKNLIMWLSCRDND